MRSRHLKMPQGSPGGPTRIEQRKRQRARERAAGLAARALPIGVRKIIEILRNDPDPRNKIAAFNTLADRGGLPKLQANYSVEDVVGTVKTVVHRSFEPPASFSETPPEEVLRAVREFEAAQANGGVAKDCDGEHTDEVTDLAPPESTGKLA